jgi:hypothetical protein
MQVQITIKYPLEGLERKKMPVTTVLSFGREASNKNIQSLLEEV